MTTLINSYRFATAAPDPILLYADFEAGAPAGSTANGTVSVAFTPAIVGSFSLRTGSGNDRLLMPLPAAERTLWATFLFYYEVMNTASRHIMSFRDASNAAQIAVFSNTSQQISISMGVNDASTYVMTAGPIYRVWVEYIAGTSNDSIGRVYIADATSDFNVARPATPEAEVTNGTRYNDLTAVMMGNDAGINGGDKVYDEIKVYAVEP